MPIKEGTKKRLWVIHFDIVSSVFSSVCIRPGVSGHAWDLALSMACMDGAGGARGLRANSTGRRARETSAENRSPDPTMRCPHLERRERENRQSSIVYSSNDTTHE